MSNLTTITTTPVNTQGYYTIADNTANSSYSAWYTPTRGYVEELFKEIPVIYKVHSVSLHSGKTVWLWYKNDTNVPLTTGSLYFTNKAVGTCEPKENRYWDNSMTLDFESEENAKSITEGMYFMELNQWDKKLENSFIEDMCSDLRKYYTFIHEKLEESMKDLDISVKLSNHKSLDSTLNIKYE